MSERRFKKGDRVRLSPSIPRRPWFPPGDPRHSRLGTVTGPSDTFSGYSARGQSVLVLWDGLKIKQAWSESYLEPAP